MRARAAQDSPCQAALPIAYTSLAHCLPAEDKSFRHPRTAKSKSAETNFKMPCGVIQMPEPMLKDTDTLTLQTEVCSRTCFQEVDAPVLLSDHRRIGRLRWAGGDERCLAAALEPAQVLPQDIETNKQKLGSIKNDTVLQGAKWLRENLCSEYRA